MTKNAISVAVRDRAKRTKILDHKGYKSQITNIFKNSKFCKKNKNVRLDQKHYLSKGRDRAKQNKIWGHKGYTRAPYFENFIIFQNLPKISELVC